MVSILQDHSHRFAQFAGLVALGIVVLFLQACSGPAQILLMPTPTLYEQHAVEPFPELSREKQATHLQVFYASGRRPTASGDRLPYGNAADSTVHLGVADVIFGEGRISWNELLQASTEANREQPVIIELGNTTEMAEIAKIPVPDNPDRDQITPAAKYLPAQQPFFDRINAQLSHSPKKEIIIYVHGTKVDFLNAVTLTGEIDHFTGRQFVTLAFDWSSHQNILDYVVGIDKRRAVHASYQFKNLLQLLTEHTDAQKIHVVSYSAGGRVVSRALHQLALEHGDQDKHALRKRFRLGTVIFAAADVEADRFLSRLEDIASLSQQTVVTVSDADEVLDNARTLMRGEARAGSAEAEAAERAFIEKHHLKNVYIVDVSRHKELRGFNIEGHHYWYRHPWMSSDVIFLLKHGAPPHERALTRSEEKGIWYFAPDYPDAVRAAARLKTSNSEQMPQ